MAAGSAALFACGETVTQIDPADVVDVRVSADSARVGVDRTLDLDAFTLDARGGLLVGQVVTWSSSNTSVVTVDQNGLLTGEAIGTANVVASFGSLQDTTFVTVVEPPRLVLSADSVGFTKAADADEPAPDTVDVTNGGVLDLLVSVDSIVYGLGPEGWLSAQLSGPVAPAQLELSTTTGTITAVGTYDATVWLSGVQADDSPASIEVTLTVVAGAPFSMTLEAGDGQSATAGSDVTVAPSVRVLDEFANPAVGASVTFAVTGGGGSVAGSPATANAAGIARIDSWTLGTVAGANELTATLGSLTPVVFSATGLVGPATQVVIVDGNNQGATAGTAVAIAPTVSVRDQYGNGVTGVDVAFAVTSGGGSITGGNQVSGAAGIAALGGNWTLGLVAGPNTLSASADGVAAPAVFTATGLSGLADSIFYVAGAAQTDTVAATLPVAYRVRVVDTNGNGVEGVPVTWSATVGGGSITPNSVTDADGYAVATRVLGTVVGPDSATATVGLKGSPVRFGATATVGSPNQVVIVNGNSQNATVATAVAVDPQVRVVDKFANPIQGVPVTFSVITGGTGAAVVPVTPINTNASGLATVTSWTLGQTAGTNNNTLRATATGIATFVTFTASALAGAPASIVVSQGNSQTAITGASVATNPTVLVRDQYLNPVSGHTVSFSASGSGSVGSPSPATNASGLAATSWFVNVGGHSMATNGTFQNTLTATVSGTALSTQFTGFARYSYATHVNPLWTATTNTPATQCAACHGGTSGLTISGTAAANYAALVNVNPVCDATLVAGGWRRVSSAGGNSGHDLSVILRLVDSGASGIGTCNDGGSHATKMSAANLAILRAWIRNGAPNN